MAEETRIQQPDAGLTDGQPLSAFGADDLLGPPPPAPRLVPWSGFEILAILCLCSLWPGVLYQMLGRSGWYRWFYGPDFLDAIEASSNAAQQLGSFRLMLWAGCAALPFQVATALLILRAASGTRPADLGLTTRRLGRNLLAGLVAAVVLVPGVYAIQALVVLLVGALGGTTRDHPFTELGQQSLYRVEWVLLVLAAAVVAPIWEELFFRGIVQPWVIDRPWGGAMALVAALAMALAARSEAWQSARGVRALLEEMTPALVLLALVPVYALLALRSRPAAGLFAAAVLFAWVHVRVWPSPIPLVWLALGLGWLARRTRSLAGPIVLHACFNGVACAILLWPVVRSAFR